MKIDVLAVLRRNPDGTATLFSPEYSRIIRLNRCGVIIYDALASGKTLKDAETEVIAAFGNVPPEELKADIRHFIDNLKSAKLLN